MNICLTGEHSLGALEPNLAQLHFVKGAEELDASSLRTCVSHAALCNAFAALTLRKSHCLEASPSSGM